MSRTLDLRKVFLSELNKVHSNCYYEIAPESAKFPYLIVEIERIGENYQCEINVYDKNTSTVTVETITDAVESYFNRYIYRDEIQTFTTSLNVRNNVQEDDKSIKRRRIVLDIKQFGREM